MDNQKIRIMKTKTITQKQAEEAFAKWNQDVKDNPKKFKDKIDTTKECAKRQAAALFTYTEKA